jgi:hypothetical protein
MYEPKTTDNAAREGVALLTCPALTQADIINVCELLTGECYYIVPVRLGGIYRQVCRPVNHESASARYLLVEDAAPDAKIAHWGQRLGDTDVALTRAFTILARAWGMGLLRQGTRGIESALVWEVAL